MKHPQRTAPPIALAAVLAGIGLGMLALNLLTPLAADDYFFACRLIVRPQDGALFPAGRLTGLWDLLTSLKASYAVHSGRMPVQAAEQLVTLLPGWLFDCINSGFFVLLIAGLVRLARPSRPAAAWSAAGAAGLVWLAAPAFGQNFLWQTGAVNYLWTMAVTVWFLRPFVQPDRVPRSRRGAAAWFVLGLVSGWSMENQSAAACLLCAARLVRLRCRRAPLPPSLVWGTAGQWLGFVLLMAAPGNFRRSAGYGQSGFGLGLLPARLVSYTAALWAQLWWLIVLAAVLALVLVLRRPRQAEPALWLLLGALACHGAMALSPSYPLRSMLGTGVFLIGAVLVSANRLILRPLLPAAACAVLAVLLAVQLPAGVSELAGLRAGSDARAAWIVQCRQQGQTQVTVPILPAARTRFSPFWGDALSDLMQNPTNERNVSMAYYYGVGLIRGDPDMTLPAPQ